MPFYMWLILLVLALFLLREKKNGAAVLLHIHGKRNIQEVTSMVELAKRFIGKECIISIITASSPVTGTIEAVEDHGLLVTQKNNTTLLNLEYVSKIQEYPRGKSGKKKAVVID